MGAWSYRITNWPHIARTARFSSEKIAFILGISHRQLQRHIREIHGLELRRWLNDLRLHESRHLLDGKRPVKEVAFILGFKQHSHFTREFKKMFGVTPEQFSRSRFLRNPQFEATYLEIQAEKNGYFAASCRV